MTCDMFVGGYGVSLPLRLLHFSLHVACDTLYCAEKACMTLLGHGFAMNKLDVLQRGCRGSL